VNSNILLIVIPDPVNSILTPLFYRTDHVKQYVPYCSPLYCSLTPVTVLSFHRWSILFKNQKMNRLNKTGLELKKKWETQLHLLILNASMLTSPLLHIGLPRSLQVFFISSSSPRGARRGACGRRTAGRCCPATHPHLYMVRFCLDSRGFKESG
jgi:hypothetical protein